jgi:serine/threonine-protein kinase RsbT
MRASPTSESVKGILGISLNPIVARGVLGYALKRCGLTEDDLDRQSLTRELVVELEHGLKVMAGAADSRDRCGTALRRLLAEGERARVGEGDTPLQPVTIEIRREADDATARKRTRELAQALGFGIFEQSQIGAAVCEVCRNIRHHAGHGALTLAPLVGRAGMRIEARDRGPGIADVASVLEGSSGAVPVGGLRRCQQLMNRLQVLSGPGRGTLVIMERDVA